MVYLPQSKECTFRISNQLQVSEVYNKPCENSKRRPSVKRFNLSNALGNELHKEGFLCKLKKIQRFSFQD